MLGPAHETSRLGARNPFIGSSAAIRKLEEQSRLAAATGSAILLLGESGTGQSELARWIHGQSSRASEPMFELNCSGFSKELLESELFGHEKDAFTGAVNTKVGLLEAAHHGTAFLDAIECMDRQIQLKLLQVLEEKRFRRPGEVRDRKIDFRLIAGTHQRLDQLVREQRFRSDLFYRISAIQIVVPPLRGRPEDIPGFAQHLLDRVIKEHGREPMQLTQSALMKLQKHAWPGNIHELRNVLEKALLETKDAEIHAQDLDFAAGDLNQEGLFSLTLKELERRYILQILHEENGRASLAAKRLDIPLSTLYKKLKDYGPKVSGF